AARPAPARPVTFFRCASGAARLCASDEPMHTIWPLLVAVLTAAPRDRRAGTVPVRVRAAANAVALLEEAAARSPTVRDLIARLEATHVIVYVERTPSHAP